MSEIAEYVPTPYISTTETAKLIRAQLKKAFPGQKFSVRSKSYAGGSSISVYWTDGPTTKQVDAVTAIFSGSDFDGMVDLKTYNRHWLNPDGTVSIAHAGGQGSTRPDHYGDAPTPNSKLVSISADFVFANRETSPEWRAAVFTKFSETVGYYLGDPNGGDWSVWNQEVPLSVDRTSGKLYHMVETDTESLSSVFHQFTGHRQGGDTNIEETS